MSQNEERQRFVFLKSNLVTVEPVAFLALFSLVLSSSASKAIAIDKVCRVKLKIDDVICDAIQGQNHPIDEYDHMVNDYYSWYSIWENVMVSLLPCILLLFIGGWSDRTGRRRIILLLPVIGRNLQIMSSFLNAVLYTQIPLEVHIYCNALFVNIFGGSSLMFFAMFTYVCVTSSSSSRVYRLAAMHVCSITGLSLGMSLSRVLLGHLGYFPLLGVSLIMNAMTSLYIIYKVSDPKRTNEQMMYNDETVSVFLKNFFNFDAFKETAEVISKKTLNNRELQLCLQVLSMTIVFSVLYGEVNVLEMIFKYNYGWDQSVINSYNTFNLTLSTVGLLITVGVVTKWCKCHDSVIGIVSSVSRIASSFVHCFVTAHIFFIGPIVNILNWSSTLAIPALYSKVLENNEVGKINALVFLLGNLVQLVYVPLYILLYMVTRHTLPGAVHLVGAGYTVPVLIVFIWLLYDHKKETRP